MLINTHRGMLHETRRGHIQHNVGIAIGLFTDIYAASITAKRGRIMQYLDMLRGQDLYDAHGFSAMQEVFIALKQRSPSCTAITAGT